jgi:chorismate synthase
VPPGVPLEAAMLQHWLDRRKPGQNKFTTQRREPDAVQILSGVYEGQTTGTPVQLMIENTDQRSKDYCRDRREFRPGHADITYWQKYGIGAIRAAAGAPRPARRPRGWPRAAWRARCWVRWPRACRLPAIWCRWAPSDRPGAL